MNTDDLWRGLRVIWLHEPRGGYGYVFRVPVTVVKVTGKRVVVDVERKDGTKVRRSVSPAKLCEQLERDRPARTAL